jgi:hypothetical protein
VRFVGVNVCFTRPSPALTGLAHGVGECYPEFAAASVPATTGAAAEDESSSAKKSRPKSKKPKDVEAEAAAAAAAAVAAAAAAASLQENPPTPLPAKMAASITLPSGMIVAFLPSGDITFRFGVRPLLF